MTASTNGSSVATVETLVAEVRTLQVGSRQVTLSVYKQLDWRPPQDIEMFGRVRADKNLDDDRTIELVGRDANGALVASSISPPRWLVNGTPEFCHWASHHNLVDGRSYPILDTALKWRFVDQPDAKQSWRCDAPYRREDLPDDDLGCVVPSSTPFEEGTRLRLAGYLSDERRTKEQEGRGTWTYTWLTLTAYGESKVWLSVPPEVTLPDSLHSRVLLEGTVPPKRDGSPHRLVVERLVPSEEDPKYANHWLQAEHKHRRAIGEFCGMEKLHEAWLAAARRQQEEKQSRQQLFDEARALPLIVLAGLR